MGEQAPNVWDYTQAEWKARDSRRDLAYECARRLGFTPENARRTAAQVAAKEPGSEESGTKDPGSDSPPRSAGRSSRHVSGHDRQTGGGLGGGDPFPWLKMPGGD